MSTTTYSNVSVTTAATQIMASNPGRRMFTLYNNGSATLYIGMDSNVSSSNGIPVLPQDSTSQFGHDVWSGAIYGITSTGTADVRYWESAQ